MIKSVIPELGEHEIILPLVIQLLKCDRNKDDTLKVNGPSAWLGSSIWYRFANLTRIFSDGLGELVAFQQDLQQVG